MSEKPQSLKRFALLSVGLVVLLFGVANLDELTGQATGGEGGCGGVEIEDGVLHEGIAHDAKAFSGSKPRCQPLNGGLVENHPCKCGERICYYKGDVCTPYANHCQAGPKISDPDPGFPHGTPTQKRECKHDLDCKDSLRQCLGKVKYRVTNYADCDNNYPQLGFCKVKNTVEAECPVNMECIKNTSPDGVGDRCGFKGTPDVGELGDLRAHVRFKQAFPGDPGTGLVSAYMFIDAKVNGMKQFAGREVTITVKASKAYRTDDVMKIFTAYNFDGRLFPSPGSIGVGTLTLDKDGTGEVVLPFTLRAWPAPTDDSIPAAIMIPSGTYQLNGAVYIQSGTYTVEEMKMMDFGSRGKFDPFFVVP
jgi:hypothetical protein